MTTVLAGEVGWAAVDSYGGWTEMDGNAGIGGGGGQHLCGRLEAEADSTSDSSGRTRTKKHFSHLFTIKPAKDAILLNKFLERWRVETTQVYGADDNTRMARVLRSTLDQPRYTATIVL